MYQEAAEVTGPLFRLRHLDTTIFLASPRDQRMPLTRRGNFGFTPL